jgi:hypothetical protein
MVSFTSSILVLTQHACSLTTPGADAYHVITCIGTGTQRTTGVRASKLGFASIRSSPTLQNSMSSSKVQQWTYAAQLTSEPHGSAQQDHGSYFESIEMVMMSHAGI